MKIPSWKKLLLYLFLGWLLCFIYDLFLWDLHNDYKIARIEQRMVDNFWEHEGEFDLLFTHVKQLKADSIIPVKHPPGPTYVIDSFTYPILFDQYIGPDGPMYFGFGWTASSKIDPLLKAVNCVDIGYSYFYADQEYYSSLSATFMGWDFYGFRYYFVEPGMMIHEDWIKLKDGIYCKYYRDEMFCGRVDWRWE